MAHFTPAGLDRIIYFYHIRNGFASLKLRRPGFVPAPGPERCAGSVKNNLLTAERSVILQCAALIRGPSNRSGGGDAARMTRGRTGGKAAGKRAKAAPKPRDIKKITIRYVDPECMTAVGLFDEGCYGSKCTDDCCEYGCDVDLATLKLIEKHRKLIEPLIKAKIEDCFSTPLKIDPDYIGGAYRETATREEDNTCCFHLRGTKGCALFYLWATKKLPKKIVPTICRTYPITWHRGRLFVDRPLRRVCKCLERRGGKNRKVPSLFETQAREIRALFNIVERKKTARKKPSAAKTRPGKAAKKKKTRARSR